LCGRLLRSHLVEQTEKAGLSESQLSVLWACVAAADDGLSQSELAQRLLVSPALVSGLVEQLRRRRLLTGQRDKADRRRQVWRATASGRDLVQGILAAVTDWASRLDDRLGTRNVELLAVLTHQLVGSLGSPDLPETPAATGLSGAGRVLAVRKQKGAAA
jgi:DNA-binding MarR family transcriptional regulator